MGVCIRTISTHRVGMTTSTKTCVWPLKCSAHIRRYSCTHASYRHKSVSICVHMMQAWWTWTTSCGWPAKKVNLRLSKSCWRLARTRIPGMPQMCGFVRAWCAVRMCGESSECACMNACMCVWHEEKLLWMDFCAWIHAYIYLHTNTHRYICMNIYLTDFSCISMPTFKHILCMHTSLGTVSPSPAMHSHVLTYTHTYTHTYTRIQAWNSVQLDFHAFSRCERQWWGPVTASGAYVHVPWSCINIWHHASTAWALPMYTCICMLLSDSCNCHLESPNPPPSPPENRIPGGMYSFFVCWMFCADVSCDNCIGTRRPFRLEGFVWEDTSQVCRHVYAYVCTLVRWI